MNQKYGVEPENHLIQHTNFMGKLSFEELVKTFFSGQFLKNFSKIYILIRKFFPRISSFNFLEYFQTTKYFWLFPFGCFL